jgi:hypothetical protein
MNLQLFLDVLKDGDLSLARRRFNAFKQFSDFCVVALE